MKVNLNEYLKIENRFYRDLRDLLKDDLLLYCVVGSLGRRDIIPGWSDIDILLVVKKYKKNYFDNLNATLKKNSRKVQIGITIYTPKEFLEHQDPKTLHYVKSILNKTYRPRIMAKEISLKQPSEKFVQLADRVDFSKHLHTLKRELLLAGDFNEKKTYKAIVTLLKIMLREQGLEVSGYNDVLKKTRKLFKLYNLCPPEEIIANFKQKNKRFRGYVNFLNWLNSR